MVTFLFSNTSTYPMGADASIMILLFSIIALSISTYYFMWRVRGKSAYINGPYSSLLPWPLTSL